MHALQEQRIFILGLGLSGLAMARWCARHGASVTVADSRQAPPQLAVLQKDVPAAQFVAGSFQDVAYAQKMLQGVQAVFISPGLSPAETQVVREQAAAQGVPVGGELDLFMAALQTLQQEHAYKPYVLGITGTNGKTTVTSLTAELLQRAGQTVAVAGNIGPTLLDTLSAAMDAAMVQVAEAAKEVATEVTAESVESTEKAEGTEGTEERQAIEATVEAPSAFAACMPQSWVLELSSFQLHGCKVFAPTAATILNISQDHLNWHADMQEYIADKARVFGTKGVAVLNRDDADVMALLPQLRTQFADVMAAEIAAEQEKTEQLTGKKTVRKVSVPDLPWVSFGSDTPQRAGDFGLEQVNGITWLVHAIADETALPERGAKKAQTKDAAPAPFTIKRLMPADVLRIRGRHNACNALAALALATQTGAALAPMLYGLREYRGEPHRMQSIGILNGVEYFDDSKGTNVGATLAALQGLGADRKLVAIVGGEGKGQDFSVLAPAARKYCRAVVLIGRDKNLIQAALADTLADAVPMHMAQDMQQAVATAAQAAQQGDAVLLSPACASFDMFDSYVHRAEVFVQSVRECALQQGIDWPDAHSMQGVQA